MRDMAMPTTESSTNRRLSRPSATGQISVHLKRRLLTGLCHRSVRGAQSVSPELRISCIVDYLYYLCHKNLQQTEIGLTKGELAPQAPKIVAESRKQRWTSWGKACRRGVAPEANGFSGRENPLKMHTLSINFISFTAEMHCICWAKKVTLAS